MGDVERPESGGIASCCPSLYDDVYEVAKSRGSAGQLYWACCGGGGEPVESGGLGLPRMAERMEYSRLAASEPKGEKVATGSNVLASKGSFWDIVSTIGIVVTGGVGCCGCWISGVLALLGVAVSLLLVRFSCSSSSSSKRYFAFLRCPSVQLLAMPRFMHR